MEPTRDPARLSSHGTDLRLNNKYFFDRGDQVSYAGIGWVFGLHDRLWSERLVSGRARWMSTGGLERKADPRAPQRFHHEAHEDQERV